MRFPRYLTVPGRLFVFSLLHQGKMVDGIFFNNGEGRSGWVGSVNINVCPNLKAFFGVAHPKKESEKEQGYQLLILFSSSNDYGSTFQLQLHLCPGTRRWLGRWERDGTGSERIVRCYKARPVALVCLTYDLMIPQYDSHARSPSVVSLLD